MADYFIDPVNGSNATGDGTIGDPWETIQHALDTITQGVAGDKLHVKSGGNACPAAQLDFSTYGTISTVTSLVIAGYDTTALDGGRATIDFDDATYPFINENLEGFTLINLDFLNNQNIAVGVLRFRRASHVFNCRFFDSYQGITGALSIVMASNCEFLRITRLAISSNVSVTHCLFLDSGAGPNFEACRRPISMHNCIFSGGQSHLSFGDQQYPGPVSNCSFFDASQLACSVGTNGSVNRCYFEGNEDAVIGSFSNNRNGLITNCAFFDNETDINVLSQNTIISPRYLSASGVIDKVGGDFTPNQLLAIDGTFANLQTTQLNQYIGAVPGTVGVTAKLHPLSTASHPLGTR